MNAMDKKINCEMESLKGAEVDLDKYVNKKVTLEGVAYNAKLGAVVQIGSYVVYIDGVQGWTNNIVGKRISVTGLLIRKKGTPLINNGGIVKSGIEGSYYVLEKPEWKVVNRTSLE
jgi:hypothetical protein